MSGRETNNSTAAPFQLFTLHGKKKKKKKSVRDLMWGTEGRDWVASPTGI